MAHQQTTEHSNIGVERIKQTVPSDIRNGYQSGGMMFDIF